MIHSFNKFYSFISVLYLFVVGQVDMSCVPDVLWSLYQMSSEHCGIRRNSSIFWVFLSTNIHWKSISIYLGNWKWPNYRDEKRGKIPLKAVTIKKNQPIGRFFLIVTAFFNALWNSHYATIYIFFYKDICCMMINTINMGYTIKKVVGVYPKSFL